MEDHLTRKCSVCGRRSLPGEKECPCGGKLKKVKIREKRKGPVTKKVSQMRGGYCKCRDKKQT